MGKIDHATQNLVKSARVRTIITLLYKTNFPVTNAQSLIQKTNKPIRRPKQRHGVACPHPSQSLLRGILLPITIRAKNAIKAKNNFLLTCECSKEIEKCG